MNKYERLLQQSVDDNVHVCESFDLNGDTEPITRLKGLYINGHVALDKDIETTAEKTCVLAEELGHYYTSVGDILDISDASNRKQERQARFWGYNKLVGLRGMINAYEHGCKDKYEIAEYLEVTDEFLHDTIECYRDKYGVCTTIDNYLVIFIPNLRIGKIV